MLRLHLMKPVELNLCRVTEVQMPVLYNVSDQD